MGESVDSAGEICPEPDDRSPGAPLAHPRPGRYRHHKGADYRVLGCVRHSETEEWLVLYRPLYGERGLWVRPLGSFVDAVEKAGERVPRFAFVRDEGDEEDEEGV